VVAALVIGRGYALRPWRTEIAAVPEALELLAKERTVLLQSGLYPHGGYSSRVQVLTPRAMQDPANADAAILVAPRLGAFPFSYSHINWLLRRPPVAPMPGGLVAIRNPPRGELGEAQDDNRVSPREGRWHRRTRERR
jgi:hypothetical protein